MKLLEGKVALVTGGDSGIGRAVALAYAREGASVVVADRNPLKSESVTHEIQNAGGKAFFVKTDVSIAGECEAMVAETVRRFGRLDVACNNAGISGEQGPTAGYSVEGWAAVIAVNLSGVFYCCKYEVPELLKAKGGAIVNISSILGQVSFAGAPAYVAAKHGVVGLTKSVALEYTGQGVRCNSVGPAFIKTPMIAPVTADPAMEAGLVAMHPIGRLGEPEEVAELVLWLSSPQASFVSGAYYAVDGGYLAR